MVLRVVGQAVLCPLCHAGVLPFPLQVQERGRGLQQGHYLSERCGQTRPSVGRGFKRFEGVEGGCGMCEGVSGVFVQRNKEAKQIIVEVRAMKQSPEVHCERGCIFFLLREPS